MKATLLNSFPRSMGHPRQDIVVYNKKQRDKYIKKYIKKTDLYISVYKFSEISEEGEPIRASAVIDKVFFDFDTMHWKDDVQKLHKWCIDRDILHRTHFSGRGTHLFIFVSPEIDNKKEALGNFQRWINHELDLHIDQKIIGDVARIFRYPNTFNYKAMRFCIPIPSEALDNNYPEEWYLKMATKQQSFNAWSGHKLLSLKKWDTPELIYMEELPNKLNIIFDNKRYEEIKKEFPDFPACAQHWLSTPELNGKGKFSLIIFLKDQCYTKLPFDHNEIITILKGALSNDEFEHYFSSRYLRGHVGHRGIKFKSLMRKDYYMKDCNYLKRYNLCPYDCGRRHPIYN